MNDSSRYSTIRCEPVYKPADGCSLNAFYDAMTKPHALLILLAAYFTMGNETLPSHINKATINGDRASILHLFLVVLSLLAGIRLLQSLYLAKRDYPHLEVQFSDILIFLFVLLFTTGAVLNRFSKNPLAVICIYAVCALAGTLNFFNLYRFRIPDDSQNYDYPIEQRIQAVNTFVFALLTVLLTLAASLVYRYGIAFTSVYWLVGATFPLIIFNIVHSSQLTLSPKFLLHNDPDSPKNVIRSFRELLGHICNQQSDDEILDVIYCDHPKEFKAIKTIRATAGDADIISDALLESFSYIFSYVLKTDNRDGMKNTLIKLVTMNGGFGMLGYMNFYFIIDQNRNQKVGLFKIDTSHKNWMYLLLEPLIQPFVVAISLRTIDVIGIRRRTKSLKLTQPDPKSKELRLAYLVIFPEFRNNKYGETFLHLLKNAFLRNHTNDIISDRITLFVREKNKRAVHVFEKAGFGYKNYKTFPTNTYYFTESPLMGKALFMTYERT